MAQAKYLLGQADSAIANASWGELGPIMTSHRISADQLESLLRVAFLFLPKIVIQASSVANNPILADMYLRNGRDFLSVLRRSTEMIADGQQQNFTDLVADLRARGAYGLPAHGEARRRHDQWIAALDQNGVDRALHSVDLSRSIEAVQSDVFSMDRLEDIGLGNLAGKLSDLEVEYGPLVGRSSRTSFFQLADTVSERDSSLAEDIRWMSTGSLFLTIANSVEADLVLPNMNFNLFQSHGEAEARPSPVGSIFQNTPVVSSKWLDDSFHTLSFETIEQLRGSEEFLEFSSKLSDVINLPSIDEGRANLQKSLTTYVDAIAFEVGKPRTPPGVLRRARRLGTSAKISNLIGYATTPTGGVLSAISLLSPSLVFAPVIGVVLAGVGMIFTGRHLARQATTAREAITRRGYESAAVAPTTRVSVADVVAQLGQVKR